MLGEIQNFLIACGCYLKICVVVDDLVYFRIGLGGICNLTNPPPDLPPTSILQHAYITFFLHNYYDVIVV